jgi:flagellar hook protein FlgE
VLLTNGTTYYARTGSFTVNKDGFIVDQATGYRLAVLNSSNQPVALNISAKQTSAPVATTKITFANNLSSSATTASVSDINVFDSDGGKQTWTVTLTKADPSSDPSVTSTNSWTVAVTDTNGKTVGTGTLNFIGSAADPTTSTVSIAVTPTDGASAFNVALDFSQVSSFSAGTASTISASSVDGNGAGTLTDVTVTKDGQIQLAYSNGKTSLEGAIAIADIQDPQDLQRAGSGLYQTQAGQTVRLLASGQDGVGTLEAKQLESSNVNLSNEFGSLIVIERGFQASSQVLSIANEMIQQLFGIRGQGG